MSIYGPNKLCKDFFFDIDNVLSKVSHLPIIIAGDWNCTPSTDPVSINPDCFNMKSLPNLSHSKQLTNIMEKLSLVDPYRCYHLTRHDYSFVPRDVIKTTRSRIDFFLISESLLQFSEKCEIETHLQCHLFDHKAVRISFCKEKNKTKNLYISNYILNDKLTNCVVKAAAIECYIHHCPALFLNKGHKLRTLAAIRNLIRDTSPEPVSHPNVDNRESELCRANNIAIIKAS